MKYLVLVRYQSYGRFFYDGSSANVVDTSLVVAITLIACIMVVLPVYLLIVLVCW